MRDINTFDDQIRKGQISLPKSKTRKHQVSHSQSKQVEKKKLVNFDHNAYGTVGIYKQLTWAVITTKIAQSRKYSKNTKWAVKHNKGSANPPVSSKLS